MAVVSELIRVEENGAISFGDYTLPTKSKVEDFFHDGSSYKVKTFNEITKLERDGMFVYESVPGTSVENLMISADEISFSVEGNEDAQVTFELEPETEYDVLVAGKDAGRMKTNLGGKLSLSVELEPSAAVDVTIKRL